MKTTNIEGNFTNKSNKVIAILKMLVAQVFKEIMSNNTRYRNEKILIRCDDNTFVKQKAG